MKTHLPHSLLFALLLALALAACSPPSTAVSPAQQTFSDPFAYCAAVGTLDAPDARYTGEPVPETIISGFKKAADLEDSTMPLELFQRSTVWRCMNKRVYACNFGANLPCDAKANLSKVPSQEMRDFCAANPNAEIIPAVAAGRETIFSWHCVDGSAKVLDQVDKVDEAGYLARIWYAIGP